MMKPIRELLNTASHGILFSEETTKKITPQLQQLSRKNGLDAFIELISILLTETNQTISEIAVRCGFYNRSNLNRIFKKNKGCTPSQYRENFSGIKRVSQNSEKHFAPIEETVAAGISTPVEFGNLVYSLKLIRCCGSSGRLAIKSATIESIQGKHRPQLVPARVIF